ncbi:MAG: alanine dehydrogenase [Parvularculaceae bacterium]
MLIGVPKEIKNNEFRVGLTPASVREYAARGHKILVETNAGHGIAATDADYERAGAQIAQTAEEVFEKAEMIVKVKEPQPVEWARLREGQILFTYLHLAPDPEQTKGLVESGVTAVAYETITDKSGGLPLLAPMSEVAGRLSIQAASESLRAPGGGRGVLMGGVPGVPPARILVVGGGIVGYNAARMAVGFGADVTILDRSVPRLRQLDEIFHGQLRTRYSTRDVIEEEIALADAVIGAVLVPGASAPKIVTREMLKMMKPRAVLVDVSIDQGGTFSEPFRTSREPDGGDSVPKIRKRRSEFTRPCRATECGRAGRKSGRTAAATRVCRWQQPVPDPSRRRG